MTTATFPKTVWVEDWVDDGAGRSYPIRYEVLVADAPKPRPDDLVF